MIRRPSRSLPFLCALLVGACYEYLPARDSATLIGRRVQLSLTDSGTVAMGRQAGPSVEAIEGDLVADSGGTYIVRVMLTRTRNGAETDWRGERLNVSHALVSSFAERRLSRSRSSFAGALMTAGIVAATVGLRGDGGSTGGGVPTPGRPTGQ
jgi:hypothetical protein